MAPGLRVKPEGDRQAGRYHPLERMSPLHVIIGLDPIIMPSA